MGGAVHAFAKSMFARSPCMTGKFPKNMEGTAIDSFDPSLADNLLLATLPDLGRGSAIPKNSFTVG
jgi:hypothetical protein